MTDRMDATGGTRPPWHRPWQWGEGHWWYWVSCVVFGVGVPFLGLAVALTTTGWVGVVVGLAAATAVFFHVARNP